MFSHNSKPYQRRAVTLAELLVTIALSAIIIGILLGIFIETRKSTTEGQERIAMENHARMVMTEIRSILEAAVPPTSLDAENAAGNLRFNPESCSIISSKFFNGKDFYLTTIQSFRDQDTKEESVQLNTGVLDPAKTANATENHKTLGSSPKEYLTRVGFEYGTEINQALDYKAYRDKLNPGEYPRIIRVRVEVGPVKARSVKTATKPASYELVTAIRVL